MDIIFQSGEFYGQDSSFWTNVVAIVGAVLGAVISGLIAIWIFKRGLNEEAKKEFQSRAKKDDELENYIFHVISFMNSTIDQQVKEIGRASQALKNYSNKNLGISNTSELSTED